MSMSDHNQVPHRHYIQAARRHHDWAWPEDYAGPVWMELTPLKRDAGKDIYFHAQWRSKMRLTVVREVLAEPFVLFFGKREHNVSGRPQWLHLNFSHEVFARFGTHNDLPSGRSRYYDINALWNPGGYFETERKKEGFLV